MKLVGEITQWFHSATPLRPNAAAHGSLRDDGSDAEDKFSIFQDVTITVANIVTLSTNISHTHTKH